jgi:hypothetical protein
VLQGDAVDGDWYEVNRLKAVGYLIFFHQCTFQISDVLLIGDLLWSISNLEKSTNPIVLNRSFT